MSSSGLDKLLKRLDLAQVGEQHYRGGAGTGGVTTDNRLYGGLVLAQASVAAMRSAPHHSLHSLHAYFLRPGRPSEMDFHVTESKNGRSVQARSVVARQADKEVFQLLASLAEPTDGPTHQRSMPSAPAPEALPNRDQLRGRRNWQSMAIDVRLCDELTKAAPLPAEKRIWMRPFGAVPSDPVLHTALFLYATDRALLSTAWRPHAPLGRLNGVSLDHSVWLHSAVDFSDWHLYAMESPVARHGRGLVQGALYRRDGERVATVVQEGTLRFQPS